MNSLAWWEWALIAVLFVWLVIEMYDDYLTEKDDE